MTSPTLTSLAAETASSTSACAEQVDSQFPRSQCFADVLGLDLLIRGKAGEIEKADVQALSFSPSIVTGMPKALAPTIPYFVFQRSPGLSPGAVPTYSLPLGTTMILDSMSRANSRVRAKMIEPSFGLIVIPVQDQTSDGLATACESMTRATESFGDDSWRAILADFAAHRLRFRSTRRQDSRSCS